MQIKTTFVVNIPNTIGATAEEEWDNGWMGESSGSGNKGENPLILVLVLALVLVLVLVLVLLFLLFGQRPLSGL